MKIVVKVGTGVLTRENGTLDGSSIVHLVSALADLMQQGHQVVLVSSGAVGAGVSVLGLPSYPQELSLKQACAAVGQTRLMQTYENLFNHFDVDVAQLLLTADDLKRRRHHVQATVMRLFEHGRIIPIVNENDTVSVEELKFGDNDILSVHIARMLEADALFILTSVDGLYPPGGSRKAIIPRVEDVDAVLAFAEEDRGRFSMGGMMTNALACAYPELFAAAAPCNGFNSGYLVPASEMWTMLRKMPTGSGLPDGPSEPVTRTRVRADAKKAAFAYRMPLIQNSGLLDGTWPAAQDDPFKRLASFDYWKTYNNIPLTPYEPAAACESGLTADETFYDCADGRFLHHRWFSRDEGKPALFEVVLAKRMPHALDLRQLELAWQFMKRFSRGKDGSLHIDP